MAELARIYLAPPCCSDPFEGRQWCEDNVWPHEDCPNDADGIEFVRADYWEPVSKLPPVNQPVLVRQREAVGEVYDVAVFVGTQPDGEQRWIMGDVRLESRQLTHWRDLPKPPCDSGSRPKGEDPKGLSAKHGRAAVEDRIAQIPQGNHHD